MKIIKVNLSRRSYNIIIGTGIIPELGKYIKGLNIGSSAYIITNPLIKNKYAAVLTKALKSAHLDIKFKLIPDSERSKSLEVVSSVLKDVAVYDKKREVFIIAFGGGVVGDMSGFLASIYKRGIPYIQVPTTLLAQVDSSIGGKTAVDLSQGKNLAGAFYQPRIVLAEINFLKSLDPRQIRAGLAEVIKYAIIKDARLFSYLEKNYRNILQLKAKDLEFIVARCAGIKAQITQKDEREERGLRTVLNFGHTIGHAIEAASSFKGYNHGEAVALGILVACDISQRLELIDKAVLERIEKLIKIMGLPIKIEGVSLEKIIKAHYYDKKFIGARNKFVLIEAIGKSKIIRGIPESVIRECLRYRIVG